MSMPRMTRRTLTATAGGFAAGICAAPLLHAVAQDATPQAAGATPIAVRTPPGYVSTRIRTSDTEEIRNQITDIVRQDFAPEVEELDGFRGYLLGEMIEDPRSHVSVLVLEEESQQQGFQELASDFVGGLEESLTAVETRQWAGDLLVASGARGSTATPAATPVTAEANGFVTVHVHPSLPGTDPRKLLPLAKSGFLPIIAAIPGFRGYLWYPTDGAFVGISMFDSQDAAEASNVAARDWAEENLSAYTSMSDTVVIKANIVIADMPIFH